MTAATSRGNAETYEEAERQLLDAALKHFPQSDFAKNERGKSKRSWTGLPKHGNGS